MSSNNPASVVKMDIQTSARPLIWSLRVFGLFPFRFEKNKVAISKVGVVYDCCIILSCSALAVYLRAEHPKSKGIERYITKLNTHLTSYTAIFTCLVYASQTIRLRGVFDKLYKIGLCMPASYSKKIFWSTVLQLAIFYMLTINQNFILSWQLRVAYGHCTLARLSMDYFLTFAIQSICILFTSCLFLIWRWLKIMNRNLVEVSRKHSPIKYTSFRILAKEYLEVFKLCENINSSLGLPIVIVCIYLFLNLLLALYDRFVESALPFPIFMNKVAIIVLRLWIIVFASKRVMDEARTTPEIVHELLLDNEDYTYQQQLRDFSLQLIHSKIEFTACGMFALDYSFLYTLAGAAITYIVTLGQIKDAVRCNLSHSLQLTTPSSVFNLTEYNGTIFDNFT